MAFTFFFRDLQTLECAVEHMLPFCAGKSLVKVWDAGCAMGQEPFSLAILLAEKMGHFAFRNLRIDASDIDGSNLFRGIIESGEYVEEELKRIPPDIFSKYFAPSSREGYFKLDERVRSRLAFWRHDLLTLEPVGSDYSLVVCKNVLLHFQPEERVRVVRMFHGAMLEGGFFIMEQTQKLPEEVGALFEQVVPNAQLFRKVKAER